MRDYEHTDFRPWYLPDTARWLRLSLGARGLVAELLRKFDRRGRLALGTDPAADLALLLRTDPDETRYALEELLLAGRVTWDAETRTLTDPDLPGRLRLGSAARMARKRALVTDVTDVTGVTPTIAHGSTSVGDPDQVNSSMKLANADPGREIRSEGDVTPSHPSQVTRAVLLSDGPPEWWPIACDTVAAEVAPVSDRGARWLEYVATRERKGWAANQRDAVGWLSQVVRSERRNDRPAPASARVEAVVDSELAAHREAYARGIVAGKGSTWAWPIGRDHDAAVHALIAAHAKDDRGKAYRGDQLLRWLAHTSEAFAADVIEAKREQYYSAFSPAGCVRWMNERHQAEEARHVG